MDDFDKMKCKDLKENELDYELKIRDLKPKGNIESKVKCLVRAIHKKLPVVGDYAFDWDAEVDDIDKNIVEIESYIALLGGSVISKTETQFRVGKSRIIHTANRIGRVLTRVASEQVKTKVCEWRAMILELETTLLDKWEDIQNQKVPPPFKSSPVPYVQQPRPSLFNVSHFSANSSALPKSIPVHKWNTKYNGSSDLLEFLEKVNDLMIARNISQDEVFLSAYDLFEGPALTWFRSIRDNISNFDELVALLKSSFLPSDNDDALWDEIRGMKQLKNESVVMYIAKMNTLFNRLSQVPNEQNRLTQIKKNLLPFYISALALEDIPTIERLQQLTKRIDEAYKLKMQNSSQQVRTPSKTINVVTAPVSNAPAPANRTGTAPNVTCWNCGKNGHLYSVCRGTRKRFCFKCGTPDVTVKSCPKCSPQPGASGNAN